MEGPGVRVGGSGDLEHTTSVGTQQFELPKTIWEGVLQREHRTKYAAIFLVEAVTPLDYPRLWTSNASALEQNSGLIFRIFPPLERTPMVREVAKAEMLIRRPVAEVFNAFVDPTVITKFWLESTSGPLAAGARVEWRFMVPGAVDTLTVTAFDDPRRIAFEWSGGMSVDMKFEKHRSGTCVAIEVVGFSGEGILEQIVGTTEGFSIVLCDLKTLLETGHSANLVRDRAELITQSQTE